MTKHTAKNSADRLDKYLAHTELATSRSEAGKWLAEGRVLVNGVVGKPSTPIAVGDQIEIDKPSLKTSELVAQDIPLDVLFEDQDLLVINKPAGLVVHPGAGNYETSLVHALLHHCKGSLSGIGGVERPGIVHRLDKGTSGVMVVAKNDKTHQNLTQQFQDRLVKKEYDAIVLGSPNFEERTLENLMKRSEFNRKKFVVNQKKGKPAVTFVKVLRRGKNATWVVAKPQTGRTHQIRVHLTSIGHPIVGDDLYGGTKQLERFSPEVREWIKAIDRPLLHAHKLSFKHPRTGKDLVFEQEPSPEFQKAAEYFEL